MNTKNKIKSLIAAAVFSGCTAAPLEEQVIENCALTFPSDPVLKPYIKALKENTNILQATQLCTAAPSLQQLFWDKLKLAEETNAAPSNTVPASFNDLAPKEYFMDITVTEAEQIQAAYLAHALWIDQNGVLPWKLADYQPEELNTLFNPKNRFWRSPEKEKYQIGYLLDHSPAIALSIAQKTVDINLLTDQKSTIINFVKKLRHFRHGNPGAKNSEGKVYCFDSEMIPTLEEMDKEKISRFGCKSMASYACSLATAYNIPCETTEGYYDGVGHRTALLKSTEQVLAHGDNAYEHYLLNTPSEKLLDNYQFWEEEILAHPAYSGLDSEVAHQSRVHEMNNIITYPSNLLMKSYCQNKVDKKAALENYFGEYFDGAKLDLLEQKIMEVTQNCTVIPKDDPDGTGESYNHICTL
ncbi:MAG: hypothetical protein Q8R47_03555 [Nanoarchaeota archaeon]|nr:hypothetical protein [Nanoarchaeota archaeon]